MRATWTGALSFGLINIPIRLYSATTENHGLNLDMLHKTDKSRIRFARICETDGKEVPYKDIVKGYQYKKGEYVILEDADFEKANVRKTKTIDILEFTEEEQIDTIYYEKPFYLEPGKGGDKGYALLREALKKADRVGVARYVFHSREHIGLIKPYEDLLLLQQLRFDTEIKKPTGLKVPKEAKVTQNELSMTLKLIDQLSTSFDPKDFHDTYTEELEEIIAAKAKGKKPRKRGIEPRLTEVQDIMTRLKESLEKHQRKSA